MSPTQKRFNEMEKKLQIQIEERIVAQMTPILERRFEKTGNYFE